MHDPRKFRQEKIRIKPRQHYRRTALFCHRPNQLRKIISPDHGHLRHDADDSISIINHGRTACPWRDWHLYPYHFVLRVNWLTANKADRYWQMLVSGAYEPFVQSCGWRQAGVADGNHGRAYLERFTVPQRNEAACLYACLEKRKIRGRPFCILSARRLNDERLISAGSCTITKPVLTESRIIE